MEISDEEYKSLITVIKTKYNIDFSNYEPKSFRRRLARAIGVFKLDGVHGLWAKLLSDRDFIFDLIDQLTVGLTTLFRDPIMWSDLKTILRLEYSKAPVKVWHAGCSTGEEVYSMGITMREAGVVENARVLATDLNNSSIVHAKKGEYNKSYFKDFYANYSEFNKMRRLESYLLDNSPETNGIKFNTDLISHVEFDQRNLVEFTTKEKFDIIFCRNVMIYFDDEMKRKLLDDFYNKLNKGGKFIVGFYDSILPIIDHSKFEMVNERNKIFQKI